MPPHSSSILTLTRRSVLSTNRGTSSLRRSATGHRLNSILRGAAIWAAEFFAIWPGTVLPGRGRLLAESALSLIDGVLEQVRLHPNELALCTSPAEILAARAAGKFAILMGIEGGHAIENSLALLRIYYALGVRYMTLTWANSNEWADSSGDVDDPAIPHHNGLTDFGREVVAEMNRLGMMIDVSHVVGQDVCRRSRLLRERR